VRQRGHHTNGGISLQNPRKSTLSADSGASGIEPEDEFSLKHYDSDEQKTSRKHDARTTNLGDDSDCDEDDEDNTTNVLCLPKIFYCSRTHSQISQFSCEIKRTAFANARCVTLGSRKNMCINSDVNSAESDAKISEICLEMHKSRTAVKKDAHLLDQRPAKKRTTGILPCPFHAKHKELDFADHALGGIRDIESLTSLGKELDACPYYGTRKALKNAQVCSPSHVPQLHKCHLFNRICIL
jgi:chromosome transmission fidelity protein 1